MENFFCKTQVYQNDQRPLKRTEKMFPRKKIFFVRAAPPLSPPRPYKFVWTLTTLEGITYYIQNTLKHPYCKTNMHNKFDRPNSLILEIQHTTFIIFLPILASFLPHPFSHLLSNYPKNHCGHKGLSGEQDAAILIILSI